jgi:hypothetical protein
LRVQFSAPIYVYPSHQKRAMALSRIAANHLGST